MDYFHHKGLHSALMQALVDYPHRFMDIYIRWPGSVYDACILTNSDLLAKGEEGTLLPDTMRMLNGCNEPSVNYRLRRARLVLENAFGHLIMKRRWMCLLKRNDAKTSFAL